MVHLNLATALLLGLVVFVSGLETAKGHRVSVIIQQTHLNGIFLTGWLYSGYLTFTLLFSSCFQLGIM